MVSIDPWRSHLVTIPKTAADSSQMVVLDWQLRCLTTAALPRQLARSQKTKRVGFRHS
ncbi:MAG: hypothetical protein V7L05_17650 [Nostoc sp.]|uniref:hypothetical protein n=1 Tax=Nostoc sp. TaxID=1180 RepID=UPI002FF6DF06